MRPFFTSLEEGIKNQLWASVSKDYVNGEYYEPVGVGGFGIVEINSEAQFRVAVSLYVFNNGRSSTTKPNFG